MGDHASSASREQLTDVAVDPFSGTAVAAGYLQGIPPQYPGITSLYGSQDGFIAKYDTATGALIWAFNIGGSGMNQVNAIDVDSDGSIYATGYFEGPMANFSGTSGPATVLSATDRDMVSRQIQCCRNPPVGQAKTITPQAPKKAPPLP